MREVSYDNTFGMVDLAVYTELMAQDNKDQINRLKRNLTHALRQDVTERQREYKHEYGGHRPTVRGEQVHRVPHLEAGTPAAVSLSALWCGKPVGAGGKLVVFTIVNDPGL